VEKEEAEIGIEAIFNKYWKDLHLIEVNFKILLVINKLHIIFINKFEHGGCIMLNEQCEKMCENFVSKKIIYHQQIVVLLPK
jgi:hypothetical protein